MNLKFSHSSIAAIVFAAMTAPAAAIAAPAYSWNLERDMVVGSLAGGANPLTTSVTDGVFSFHMLNNNNTMQLLSYQPSCNHAAVSDTAFRCWNFGGGAFGVPFVGITISNTPTVLFNNASFFSGPGNFTLRTGMVNMHPGPVPGVVRWTKPANLNLSNVRLLVKFADLDHPGSICAGDGIGWKVVQNGSTVLGSGTVQDAVDGATFTSSIGNGVNTLDVILDSGPNFNFACDSTNVDLLITADGQTCPTAPQIPCD